ncbi:MAG TPA: GNAT family N-acetyltransferase [Allosphingosinicella sp.]|nr:GNAT family N-acetyltransferase [Allosphingosinicella sp.]
MSLEFPTAAALGVGFRPAEEADLPFLATLYASTRWEELAPTGWPIEAQQSFLADQFALQHRHYTQYHPDAARLVVERDGAPIGRVYLDESDSRFNLIDIALLPEHRGGGIGGAILNDLVRHARETGRAIDLFVEKNNPVRGLYKRLGFVMAEDAGVYDRMEWLPPRDA